VIVIFEHLSSKFIIETLSMILRKWLYIIPILISISCLNWGNHIEINNDYTDSTSIINDTSILHFFVIGDWGWNGSAGQTKVAHQMDSLAIKVKPKFILTCGDNFQYKGVKSVDDTLWKINYEQVYNFSSLKIPWYPALSNHSYLGNVNAEIEYSKKNKYWCMPARYYSFTKGTDTFKVRFIILDTQDLINSYNNLSYRTNINSIEQIRWLNKILIESKQDWIFIIGHHPVFSSGRHGNTKRLVSLLKPILESYNVDFYICGHDHDFEHVRLPNKNTEYIVTGTGGSTRPIKGNSKTVFCLSTLGFTCISVSKKNTELDFITGDGVIAYSFTKTKPVL
jgi:tartrate-resistant acid phosphatase type 5